MTSTERVSRLRFLTVLAAALAVLQSVALATGTGSRWLGVLLAVGFTGLSAYFAVMWRRESERLREQHLDA